MGKIKYVLFTILPLVAIAGLIGYPKYKSYVSQQDCDAPLEDPEAAVEGCTWIISQGGDNLAAAHNNRGLAWQQVSGLEEAIGDFNAALEQEDHPEIYRNRADTYNMMGSYKKARRDYRRALEMDNTNPSILNNAAWFYATCPEKKYRDGKRAVKLAERATDIESTPARLGTLAAAHAELGNFDKAVEFQTTANEFESTDIGVEALALFTEGKPYRAPKP